MRKRKAEKVSHYETVLKKEVKKGNLSQQDFEQIVTDFRYRSKSYYGNITYSSKIDHRSF